MSSYTFSDLKRQLIINNRTTALKIARSLLKRWDIFLDLPEIQSISDSALCEAVRGYDTTRGTKFITYLFPYIKGALIAEFKFAKKGAWSSHELYSPASEYDAQTDIESNNNGTAEIATEPSASPEYQTYLKELQLICSEALSHLQPLEREVIIQVDMLEEKVAHYARRIGYSRPYLSSLHSKAINKIQPYLERMAA